MKPKDANKNQTETTGTELDDSKLNEVAGGEIPFTKGPADDGYDYVLQLHHNGEEPDDGITAQYCKISSAGKVTAHFNSF